MIHVEFLARVVVPGMRHLQYLINQSRLHDHNERPYQGLDNRTFGAMENPLTVLPFQPDEVVCHERLGGLLKHYECSLAA